MRHAFRARLLAGNLMLCAAAPAPAQQPASPAAVAGQQPHAGSRTVVVDVVVVDGKNQPMTGMSPSDFNVTLDGETRPIVRMQYVVKGRGALAAARALSAAASVPVTAETSRLVVFAVDEDSIDAGAEKPVAAIVGRVVDSLAVNDRVLLVTLPSFSPNLVASQDRGALRQDLPAIKGRAGAAGGGLAEDPSLPKVPIIAADEEEAAAARARENVEPKPQQPLETPGLRDLAEAPASRSARALAGLMDGLREIPGPKTVIVFSGGGPGAAGDPRPSFSFTAVADAAASARVVVHAVRVPRSGRRFDGDLEELARLTGGCAVRASGAARDLEALDAAMAGSYVLQVAWRPDDERRLRRLRVTATRRGPTVLAASRWTPREDPVPPPLPEEPRPAAPAASGVSAAEWVATVTRPARPRLTPNADPELEAVMARVSEYLAGYLGEFHHVVAEEVYVQHIGLDKPNSRRVELRRLRSDLLIVQTSDATGWAPFRDVFEVDGEPVRDRERRLEQLFLSPGAGGIQQAALISEESARFNLGDIRRTVNLPTLALEFLLPGAIRGSHFVRRGEETVQGVRAWRIDFEEWRSPTLIRTGENGWKDFPAGGTIWVEPLTGRIVKTQVKAADASVSLESTVLYERNDTIGIWTPAEMRESYERSTGRIGGEAKYLNFRRFQVTTEEKVKVPK